MINRRITSGADSSTPCWARLRDWISAIPPATCGAEKLDPRPAEGEGGAWPFLATHFQYSDLRERVSGTIVAGVGFSLGGRRVRLEGRGHFGPTPMAQFREADEWFVGGGLRIEI